MILNCIVCEKELKPSQVNKEGAVREIPVHATRFTAYGDYGSTVIDSMGATFIEINVCTECLRSKGKRGFIFVGRPVHAPRPEPEYHLWDGEEDLQ